MAWARSSRCHRLLPRSWGEEKKTELSMPRQDATLCQSHSLRSGFAPSGFIALPRRE